MEKVGKKWYNSKRIIEKQKKQKGEIKMDNRKTPGALRERESHTLEAKKESTKR